MKDIPKNLVLVNKWDLWLLFVMASMVGFGVLVMVLSHIYGF